MSGITLSLPSPAAFTNYVDRAVPYLSSAIGYYLFGTDGATSTPNLVPGAVTNLTVNGAPTYGSNYAQMAYPNDYFGTGLSPSLDQTVVVVVTQSTGGDYYASNASTGLLLGMSGASSTSARFSSAFGPTAVGTFNPGSSFGFLAGTTLGTTGNPFEMYAGSAGALTLTTNGSLGANLTSSQIFFGPKGQFTAGVGHKLAAAMLFDTRLTQVQLTDIYQYFQFALPKRGIVLA